MISISRLSPIQQYGVQYCTYCRILFCSEKKKISYYKKNSCYDAEEPAELIEPCLNHSGLHDQPFISTFSVYHIPTEGRAGKYYR